ncbi:biotin-dependent carboxyltransferase family protein [Paraburkholderia nemoris]|uniref:5-oxoprolinase subunit C n=1 Tax=Paraburkholderia nemoris TaxID=2793076 RepID=A0ABM8SY75_9BURK|nr:MULTISPECIES: biotin-dependent carboxyltransferase family protein [Paraburkholderia]MBK3815212.1 biotin-dependent carboxyltransferase [Paraburkholderia aspalathi]CAE6713845.1 5-oxoprolinase subunit C [Paraburkholderia nemoris]CAE6839637.1 5-oxoprolinase subunit C [Paraburkholderia nemoris]
MIEVIKPGLETCIQDWPGRIGYLNQGFPPSGPMDSWSFRLANLLVGNHAGDAAIECQYVGPVLKLHSDAIIAITGANMHPTLDGEPIPLWESVAVSAGATLTLSKPPQAGVRTYVAISGGIDADPWLSSRSTFAKAKVGGVSGSALRAGDRLKWNAGKGTAGRRVKPSARPPVEGGSPWTIEVVRGPNDDWIDEAGHDRFLSSDWKLSGKSDRTGFRLEGPQWTFTEKAYSKEPEHGSEPSNIVDQGYPIGAINLAGQTPIILVNDGPSMGGFINPYTVPSAAFWKLGQSRPGEIYRFKTVSIDEAQQMARALTVICQEDSIA